MGLIKMAESVKNKKKKKKPPFKKYLASLIIGFVAVAFVGSFAYNYAAKRGGKVNIAVVNGEPIVAASDSLFANFYRQFYEEAAQKNKNISEEENLKLLRKALDAAIQRTLILQYAKKEKITPGKKAVLASIIEKGYYASPNKNFDEERYNNTPESDRQRIYKSEEEQLTINLFLEEHFKSIKVTNLEVKSFFKLMDYGKKIEYIYLRYDNLPEKVLKKFYDENPRLFEKAHVAHILIKNDEEKAKKILEEVKKNPDKFAEIAKKESEDNTKDKGGDLGWFYRDEMLPEFSEAAFKLKKGEIGFVKTVFGYHIIKALDNPRIEDFDKALYRVKKEYVKDHREELEKKIGKEAKEILEVVTKNPDEFEKIASEKKLHIQKTDYITLAGRYILNENKNLPLFELMNVENLPELVFKTKLGQVGSPIKTIDGEIIFKVIEEKSFKEEEYNKVKDYLKDAYKSLKENTIFNDWYTSVLKKSRIVDNFDKFFKPKQKS